MSTGAQPSRPTARDEEGPGAEDGETADAGEEADDGEEEEDDGEDDDREDGGRDDGRDAAGEPAPFSPPAFTKRSGRCSLIDSTILKFNDSGEVVLSQSLEILVDVLQR